MSTAMVARDLGLRYARANLLLGPGDEALALYRLAPTGYPLPSSGTGQSRARPCCASPWQTSTPGPGPIRKLTFMT